MQRLLHTPLALLLRRILTLYVVLWLCRILFYSYNHVQLGAIGWPEVGALLRGSLLFDTASVLYANALFVVLSLLPFEFCCGPRYQKMLFWYYTVVNFVLIVAANLADAVYFHYTQKRITADEFLFADNDNSLLLVFKFMGENWPLLLAALALGVLLVIGFGRRTRCESILNPGWSYYTLSTVTLCLAAGLSIAGIRGGVTRATRPITLSNATLYTPDPGKANLILSNPFCLLRTIGHSGKVRYRKDFSEERLQELFSPEHRPAADSVRNVAADTLRGALRGRNVLIFILESMSAEHSAHLRPDLYADRPEQGFTPFLDSLMRSGLTFRRMYANGTRSIQAMPSVLGSIPSFKTPFVLMPQALGRSRQLPAILAEQGYSTLFFCGSERGSMGFGAYARSAGVERYATALPEGYTRIHKGIAYDDMAFRRFFARFGHEKWFRNTLFVFVADHVSSEKFAPESREYPGSHHIVGFLYTPDGALQGEIGEVTQQLDIMPTVLGLLGNDQPYFAFGRDLLSEPDRPRWALSYDGQFRAWTDRGPVEFDDALPPAPTESAMQQRYRALVQQYYSHIERKSYVVDD